MVFSSPAYFFLLLLLIPVIGWYIWKLHKADASLQLPSTESVAPHSRTWRIWLLHVPFVLRVALIILLSVALARPQRHDKEESNSTEGIDIMLALDISSTMLAEDLQPNRLEAAKSVATDFIKARPNDNMGIVIFAEESFTQCPLTTDHHAVVNMLQAIEFGMISDGTAIGTGLATAVNRMKDSPTKSKVVILLTDGSNNRGDISPQTAAQLALHDSIRVYTIGVGTKGEAIYPIQTPWGIERQRLKSEFDEATLEQIAATTGGMYFRATDNSSLKDIYEQIDQMETSKIRSTMIQKHSEFFLPFLLAALVCLILEILLRHFILRTITN